MTHLQRYLNGHLPVDEAFRLSTPNGVDLRTIEEIDQIEAEDLRVRDAMLRYVSERE